MLQIHKSSIGPLKNGNKICQIGYKTSVGPEKAPKDPHWNFNRFCISRCLREKSSLSFVLSSWQPKILTAHNQYQYKNCSFKQNWLKMGLELIKASIRKAKFRYMTKSYPAIVLPYPSHRSIDYDDDHRMIYTDCRNLGQYQTFHENFMITLRTSEFSKNIRFSTNDDFTCCKLSFQLASMFLIINSDILFLCFSSIPF